MASTIVHNDPDTSTQAGLNVSPAHLISPNNGLAVEPGNVDDIAIFASAAHTTTQTSADQTNTGARGIIVVLDVTVPGTGSITISISGKDPVSGKYYTILTGAAVTTQVTNVYRVYPGLTTASNATVNDVLPRTWKVTVTANNANSMTYSVGGILMV